MRLERISLLCILSLSLLTGCSANRAARATRHDDRPSIPPSHDHEYSPRTYEEEPSPAGETPSEPVPAPPAFGVSNVKSVGWLRDLTRRKDSRSCTTDCAEQEFPVGACTPLDSCTPEAACESACETPRRKTSLFPKVNCFSKIFKRKSTQACAEPDCTAPSCSSPEVACDDELFCAEEPTCTAPVNCGDIFGETKKPLKKLHRNPDRCLADPLQESDEHLIQHESADETPAPEPAPVPVPAPVESQPTPVPGVPVIPAIPPSARRVVEPPQWPRRAAPAVVIPAPKTAQADGTDGLPVVLPRNQI
ncbi:MAG: hypothetical protein U0996_15025 [Planctomycetaceae bacterium]